MNFTTTSRPTTFRGPLHVLQVLLTVLACVSLVLGSVLISIICLGNGSISVFNFLTITGVGSLSEKFVATLILLLPTLFLPWLLGTGALLLARRWVAAGLALPIALGVFLGLYLFIVFVVPHIPAPTLFFVLLLLLLNGGVLWLARRFLASTF